MSKTFLPVSHSQTCLKEFLCTPRKLLVRPQIQQSVLLPEISTSMETLLSGVLTSLSAGDEHWLPSQLVCLCVHGLAGASTLSSSPSRVLIWSFSDSQWKCVPRANPCINLKILNLHRPIHYLLFAACLFFSLRPPSIHCLALYRLCYSVSKGNLALKVVLAQAHKLSRS